MGELEVHFSAVEWSVFVTEWSGRRRVTECGRYRETSFHLGLEVSCAFLFLLTEVLESALLWSFPLQPEASVLQSLKRKLPEHGQNKWGKTLNCKLNARLYD